MNNTLKKVKSLFHTHTFSGYCGNVPYLYNKTNDGYLGDKSIRFDDVLIRPNIGPGSYT